MADGPDKDEKTEDPTAKRQTKFREKGSLGISKDVVHIIQLVVGLAALMHFGGQLHQGLIDSLAYVFEHIGDGRGQGFGFGDVMRTHAERLLWPMLMFLGVILATTFAAFAVQTRMYFNFGLLGFKLSKLNPLPKLSAFFNPKKALARAGLALLKLGFAGIAVYLVLDEAMPAITGLSLGTLASLYLVLGETSESVVYVTLLLMIIVAVIDYFYKRRELMTEMKMTKEEVKREFEDQEGKPEIKSKRKQKARELTINRIMQEVPKADFVLTNPTHYAVALRFRPGKDDAPVVVAKGADDLAGIIRRVARQHGVPVIEHRALARALYNRIKVGSPITTDFFQAVATILARVYQAKRARAGASPAAR